MDPVTAATVGVVHDQRGVMDYAFVAAVAVLAYDYCLTLYLEIKLIWLSPWTYTKVLFLMIRYLAYIDGFLFIYNQIFVDVSVESCRVTYPMALWVMVLLLILSETVQAIRTWAVWYGNKGIGIGLAVLTLGNLGLQCFLMNKYVASVKYSTPPFPGYRGCFPTFTGTNTLWGNYALIIAVEASVFTLMMINAFRAYRLGSIGELTRVIYRDGVIFYLYLLSYSIANLVDSIVYPSDMLIVFTPVLAALYSVRTSRTVLIMREADSRIGKGIQTELHTDHYQSLVFAAPPPLQLVRGLRQRQDSDSTASSHFRQNCSQDTDPA